MNEPDHEKVTLNPDGRGAIMDPTWIRQPENVQLAQLMGRYAAYLHSNNGDRIPGEQYDQNGVMVPLGPMDYTGELPDLTFHSYEGGTETPKQQEMNDHPPESAYDSPAQNAAGAQTWHDLQTHARNDQVRRVQEVEAERAVNGPESRSAGHGTARAE